MKDESKTTAPTPRCDDQAVMRVSDEWGDDDSDHDGDATMKRHGNDNDVARTRRGRADHHHEAKTRRTPPMTEYR